MLNRLDFALLENVHKTTENFLTVLIKSSAKHHNLLRSNENLLKYWSQESSLNCTQNVLILNSAKYFN